MNEHVAVGEPRVPAKPQPVTARRTPLAPSAPALRRDGSRFEPIEPDEVEAFRRAMAADAVDVNPPAAVAAKAVEGGPRRAAQNYTLLTGFEDTELPDEEQRSQLLSGTQFGKLG